RFLFAPEARGWLCETSSSKQTALHLLRIPRRATEIGLAPEISRDFTSGTNSKVFNARKIHGAAKSALNWRWPPTDVPARSGTLSYCTNLILADRGPADPQGALGARRPPPFHQQ